MTNNTDSLYLKCFTFEILAYTVYRDMCDITCLVALKRGCTNFCTTRYAVLLILELCFSSLFCAVVNENVSLVISRQLLTDFCTHLPNLPDGTAKSVYHFTLEKIQPRVISFEEQVSFRGTYRTWSWPQVVFSSVRY